MIYQTINQCKGWWRSLTFLVLSVVVLLLVGCQPSRIQGAMVHVENVISGQRIEVMDRNATDPHPEMVRLLGIDAPDLAQDPWGHAAKQRLEGLIAGHTIVLESDVEQRDSQGHTLAYLWQGDVLLNEKLVAEGYALASQRPPNQKYALRLSHAQDYARTLQQGIWNPDHPLRLAPGEFRTKRYP